MASRGSQHDQDEIAWQTVGLRLGQVGLDLRQPSDPRSLVKLINARFIDERNVTRRNGYAGSQLVDGSDYPQSGTASVAMNPTGWLYGFGQTLARGTSSLHGTEHYPIAGRGAGTFNFNGEDVAWTGDRLLVNRADATMLGSSIHWNTGNSTTPLAQGIPAYLPVQRDSSPPDAVAGSEVQTCLTTTQRFLVASGSGVHLTAWVTDRASGALVDRSVLGGANNPADVRLFLSGTTVVCVWRDSVDGNAYISHWQGASWSAASVIHASVSALDVSVVPGGFHLVTRESSAIYLYKYNGAQLSDAPYAHRTQVVTPSTAVPNGAVSVAAHPTTGALAVVYAALNSAPSVGGLYYRLLTESAVAIGSVTNLNADVGAYDGGLTVVARNVLRDGTPSFVCYAGQASSSVTIHEFGTSITRNDTRYRSVVASTAFCVGNEVFCWLRSFNAGLHYLVAGAYHPEVCGIADREDATSRASNNNQQTLAMVTPDPLSVTRFTWVRPYNTGAFPGTVGRTYSRPGNTRVGDLEFLPPLSAVQYGRAMYLAGSHCRAWDGIQLGDAGFHDYPVVTNTAHSNGGSLAAGQYQFRVYAVRYNALGERYQSAAVTATVTGVNLNDKVDLTISTFPVTNHDDVFFEVYRTTSVGTTFYYDGVVLNTFAAGTVGYTSTISDASLISRAADPFQTGVGNVSEIENWGPLGCEFLAVAGDRMWGAGGQVPDGFAQYSKLHEDGSGAGFDDLSELQEIDTQGGAITSIVGWQDAAVIFEKDRIYLIGGAGPSNLGVGAFDVPQMIVADGATTHVGTVLTQLGPVYWGSDGPRLLTANLQVENICQPVRPLTSSLAPTGVQISRSRREVVWFTAGGTAVLWNYLTAPGRWAEWSGLQVAGCSDDALITPDGYLLVESETAQGDRAVPFEFACATGEIRPEDVMGGSTHIRAVGLVGQHNGQHDVRLRVYFNGSPLWTDEWTWQPDTGTWLEAGSEIGDLTPAQIDALGDNDQSGGYATHKRTSRHACRTFRVELSDVSAFGPTFTPYEISLEMGAKGGLGRVPVGTFGS